MATKLKGLNVTKVDFVDAGANQQANVLLFKSKDGASKGGEKVENESNVIKRLASAIAKAIGVQVPAQEPEPIIPIAKDGASTFNDNMNGLKSQKVRNEMWDVMDAFRSSIFSIVNDDDVEDKATMMKQSVDEFAAAMKSFIDKWTAGQSIDGQVVSKMSLDDANFAKSRAEAAIAKACGGKKTTTEKEVDPECMTDENEEPMTTPKKVDGTASPKKPVKTKKAKGEDDEMKIDKSKLSPEELTFLDTIEKKAGVHDAIPATPAESNADVFKGLNPVLADMIKNLKAKVEKSEDKELADVAKKYEILGKKPEELVPLFKSMKASDPEQYQQTISILDAAVDLAKKSGAFTEIGKKGSVGNSNGSAWETIEKKAAEIRKADPNMEYHVSIDKACLQNPELVHEYEQA